MQVARASASTPASNAGSDVAGRGASYAPLYLSSSLGNMSFDLEELEGISLDRLKVLKAAERARTTATQGASGVGMSKVNAIRTAICAAERAHGLDIPSNINADRELRVLKDEASHFLLRLALCKSHEHRSWLLSTETDLFASRLDLAGVAFALQTIQHAKGPTVVSVSSEELERHRSELDAVSRGPNRQRGDLSARYYKVPFEEVPSLVRYRRVMLMAGFAYVPERNVADIVIAQFRAKLSAALMTASKAVSIADADPRMNPILDSIRQHFVASDGSKKTFDPAESVDCISLNELDSSIDAMPLCMRNMLQKLRQNHHLRHSARMQLGVFLKGCGLTMDESLRFWRIEFGKGDISGDKFEKNYAYNIRHHYGKEGKRRNLMPFPCIRIINERPGPGEHHGCPYREFQEGRLKQELRGICSDGNAVTGIVKTAQEGNFQLACGLCFAATQSGTHAITDQGLPEFVPSHPNEYFVEARRRKLAPDSMEMVDSGAVDNDIDDEELLSAVEAVEDPSHVLPRPRAEGLQGGHDCRDADREAPLPDVDAMEIVAPADIEADTVSKEDDGVYINSTATGYGEPAVSMTEDRAPADDSGHLAEDCRKPCFNATDASDESRRCKQEGVASEGCGEMDEHESVDGTANAGMKCKQQGNGVC